MTDVRELKCVFRVRILLVFEHKTNEMFEEKKKYGRLAFFQLTQFKAITQRSMKETILSVQLDAIWILRRESVRLKIQYDFFE